MAKLVWDQLGQKTYETGVDRGVLFVYENEGYAAGVAWNGLSKVSESPDGAEATKLYANNSVYVNLMSKENEKITIEAYTYPKAFAKCNGEADVAKGVTIGQQTRSSFALAYRTMLGSDTDGTNHGYKIHIIYGLLASPSEKAYSTINDSPEAITFSWSANATPIDVDGFEKTASVTIDSTQVDKEKLKELEDILYGSTDKESKILTPSEIVELVGKAA